MKKSEEITISGSSAQTLRADTQCGLYQITAFGGTGSVTLMAKPHRDALYENVINDEGDTTPITMDFASQKTIIIRGYSLYEFKFTPSGSANGTIVLTQWSD